MPFQILDFILGGIMLISGLLALMRGFTREVLSLVAWGAAALAGFFAALTPELTELAMPYTNNDTLSKVAAGGAAFLVVLIVMSVISVKLADMVLDSAIGGFDRTLGFAYGLARGLVLVVIAYLFYIWLVPLDQRETWVRNARSLPAIETVGQFIISFLPPDIAETLDDKTYSGIQRNQGAQAGTEPSVRSEEESYQPNQQRQIDQLIEGTQGGSSN